VDVGKQEMEALLGMEKALGVSKDVKIISETHTSNYL
jgi:hypothetical protein